MSTAETMVCVVRTTSRMWRICFCARGRAPRRVVGENRLSERVETEQMSGERGLIGFGYCRCAGAGC